MFKRIALILLFIGLFAPLMTVHTASASSTIYVNASASGNNNGLSWQHAYTHLQDALDEATSGDVVWVAAGIYYPDEESVGSQHTDGDRTETFTLNTGVQVYGGFDGTETTLADRDPALNVTVLSGDIDQNDTFDDGTSGPQPVLSTYDGIVPDATGLTGTWAGQENNAYHVVTGSNAPATTILDGFTITAGSATGVMPPNDIGGGIYVNDGGPTFRNLVVSGNEAAFVGGGMKTLDGVTSALSDVTFVGNYAPSWGGGMDNEGSPVTLTDVSFIGNASEDGGGMANFEDSDAELVNVTFTGNVASRGGGAMRNEELSDVTMTNVVFVANEARQGAAMVNAFTSNATILNGTFVSNTATNGGIIENVEESTPTLANSILWGNTGANLTNKTMSDVAISYSLIEGSGGSGASWNGAFGTDGGNNIIGDPLFVDRFGPDATPGTADDDLRLRGCSPAVDEGNDSLLPSGVTTDVNGDPRTDGPIDMGAFERVGGSNCTLTAVSNLTATYNSAAYYVTLNWVDNNPDEDGFRIERQKAGSDTWVNVGPAPAGASSYNDETATCDQNYRYRVTPTKGGEEALPVTSGYERTNCNFFVDVPSPQQPASFEAYIEDFYTAGITTGCNGGQEGVSLRFCPEAGVTRGAMAVFLMRALEGGDYNPQGVNGQLFADVPSPNQPPIFEAYIEDFYSFGITTGCNGGQEFDDLRFCPDTEVTRGAMAVFIVRALKGANYVPQGVPGQLFADVPSQLQPSIFEAYIEEFYELGITTGCNGGQEFDDLRFCPDSPVTRGAMAVFIVRAFDHIYGPDSP